MPEEYYIMYLFSTLIAPQLQLSNYKVPIYVNGDKCIFKDAHSAMILSLVYMFATGVGRSSLLV
jgi:hypothetical protein